jgi:hypothetical protein
MVVVNAHQCTNCDLPLVEMFLIKIIASFSSNMMIVCINYDDQNRVEINATVLNKHKILACASDGDFDAALLL